MSKKSDAVTVCVRIRPQNAAEKAASMAVVMKATVRDYVNINISFCAFFKYNL